MRHFSVIVITRNRREKALKALDSITKAVTAQAGTQLRRIIVVDNYSNHGEEFPEIESSSDGVELVVIRNDQMKGVAENRNKGLTFCDSDFILFLDDDAYIKYLNLDAIFSYFDTNINVGILAPKLLYPNKMIQESVRSFPTLRAIIWRGFRLYKIYSPPWYKQYIDPVPSRENIPMPLRIDWAIGACLIVRRDVFLKVGLFDEQYFFGYEDADFCFRARCVGYRTVYWPLATVVHEYSRSSARGGIFNSVKWSHFFSAMRFLARKSLYELRSRNFR